jgi:hypothetical protein
MQLQHYRRLQILSVAAGVASTLAALAGGVLENVLLARAGVAGFLAALGSVILWGVLAGRR